MANQAAAGELELGAEMDYPEHEKTYNFFLGLMKWGVISCIVILVFMALFLL